ncbi:kinase-like protein [Obba rivulosa]|uniref:non-specific serine/threonine protein kinase n=1 Tax=Obba rivulosa TaxID=1052685 RepID=A0A8E2AGN0_9APHY|nr:kinase-like protein [Obba rivulosa]
MNLVRNLRRSSTGLISRITASSSSFSTNATNTSHGGWEDREEPLEEYAPSGLQPVVIGDVLGSKYRVVSKLGWGVYSTVWLVQQQSNGPFAALKLLAGYVTDVPQLHELEYLQRMRDQSPTHPGHSHVLQLLDHFYHQGPTGKHLCLVTEPLAQDLHSFSKRWGGSFLPFELIKRITRQVILGLQYLHEECNIIHTDIKPANIMMAVNNDVFATAASFPIETSIGNSPDKRQITRVRSQPIPYPIPEGDLTSSATWKDVQVKLADVGVSCWADKVDEHFTDLIQSPGLRAPEVCIGAGWGKPADIWSLGCTIYELYLGTPLMRRDIQDMSVPYIHRLLFGDYPPDLVNRGKYKDVFFNDDGSMKVASSERTSIDVSIRKRGAPDADMFIDFLKLMLTLDPAKRASCEDLLAHEWLKEIDQ